MKPILSLRAPRLDPDGANAINEWKPAETHLTHDGQVEFMARMKARIAAAEKTRAETSTKVRSLRRAAEAKDAQVRG